jgi:hypothetical protein
MVRLATVVPARSLLLLGATADLASVVEMTCHPAPVLSVKMEVVAELQLEGSVHAMMVGETNMT